MYRRPLVHKQTCVAELIHAFVHRETVSMTLLPTTAGTVEGVIGSLRHEDGSGRSFIVTIGNMTCYFLCRQ